MELTKEQKKVSDAIIDWYGSRNRKRYLAVAGFAGTGKTTLMGMTAKRLIKRWSGISIAYCAPTGKAVSVLHGKAQLFQLLDDADRGAEFRPAGLGIAVELPPQRDGIFHGHPSSFLSQYNTGVLP